MCIFTRSGVFCVKKQPYLPAVQNRGTAVHPHFRMDGFWLYVFKLNAFPMDRFRVHEQKQDDEQLHVSHMDPCRTQKIISVLNYILFYDISHHNRLSVFAPLHRCFFRQNT